MPRSRNVIIRAFKDSSGKIDFEMIENGIVTDSLLFNKTMDGMPKSDSYDIIFTLRNDDGLNLEFLSRQGEPVMRLARGSSTHVPRCPTGNGMPPNNPFTVGNPNGATLTVNNTDNDICFYKFALRFLDRDTGNIETFDPIYDNRNGGQGFDYADALVAGSFTGAVAGISTLLLSGMEATTPMLAKAALVGVIAGLVAMLVLRMVLGKPRTVPVG